MPRYQVATEFFYGDRLYKAGEEVSFPGVPGDNLVPLDDAAKAAVAAAVTRRAEQAAIVVSKGSGIGEETEALIRALVGRVAALESTQAAPDLSAYVRHTDIAPISELISALRADVEEHDVGLTLIQDRLVEVEGLLATLTSSAPAPTEPAPVEPTPTEPPAAEPPVEPYPAPPVEEVPPPAEEAPAEPVAPEAAPIEPAG